ncbi:hypothetical protein [Microvirga sp. Mcv34]|uniref:hypothetical protein n=1 Tax=Microvirga sp. Mcv34 TaxID=2926016 RepID=UPI0021C60649|nr:hypothetical protein [Microvirga sp. Mcv34]
MSEVPKGRHYFYLEEIGEPKDNILRLVIVEAAAQGAEVEVPNLQIAAREIAPIPDQGPIEIVWEQYIAYSVRNESYAVTEEGQPLADTMLSERSGTAFLAFIAKSTLATHEFPGPFKHWELVCLNHVIDVVSTTAPRIRSLEPRPQ